MAFTSPTDTIETVLTTTGRDLLARMILGEVSFYLVGFKVGRDGYLPANPVLLSGSPDPAASDLGDPIFPLPTNTTKPFVQLEAPFPNVASAVARLDRNEALYGLGELGVFVRIARSTGSSAAVYTVDSDYMFGLAHMPLMSKTNKHVFVFRFIVAV